MKLPFNNVIAPMMRPYLAETKNLCENPTFTFSIPYTYFYSALGFLISVNHLRKHLGENPGSSPQAPTDAIDDLEKEFMLVHDLKIIATSMGIVQYACLLAGCYTENPALFLPHLTGQLVVVTMKIVNSFLVLPNRKSVMKLMYRVPAIMLMTFNWLQEFCVFRQTLCICDL